MKLLVAIVRPFSCAPARCCMKAYCGTTKSPLATARNATAIADARQRSARGAQREREDSHQQLPSGTRPSSTLSPESLPASMLPQPMPTARKTHSSEMPPLDGVQHFVAEEQEVGLEQDAGEPEERDAEHRQPERTVAQQMARIGGDLAERIPAERLVRAGGRHARDAAGWPAVRRRRRPACPSPMRQASPCQLPKRTPPDAVPENDRDEGAHFEQRVAARKIAVGQHLRDDAVLGGAEDGGVQPHQEDHQQHAFDAVGHQRGEADQHDEQLEDLDADQDLALADAVGEVAGVAGEEQRGEDEDRGDQRRRKCRP